MAEVVNKRMINLSGMVFGNIKILEFSYRKNKASFFKCQCLCGKIVYKSSACIRNSRNASCGCKKGQNVTIGKKRHGMCKTRIYRIWRCMLNRCEFKGHDKYKNYGAKGISVCERWHKFDYFYEDMNIGYEDKLTLNRLDNNVGYNKENCNWITQKEQCRNRSTSRYMYFNGENLTASEWAEKFGISLSSIYRRFYKKWSDEKILSTLIIKKNGKQLDVNY